MAGLFGWQTPDILGWFDDKRWFFISDIAGLGGASPTSLAFTMILALVLMPVSAYVLWRTPSACACAPSVRSRPRPTPSVSRCTA